MRGAFTAALALHASLIAAIAVGDYLHGHVDQFGSKETGAGAVAIEAVTSIPIPHHGETNPLANQSESEVPQAPLEKPKDLEKAEPDRPDAISLRSKVPKKTAPKESQHQVFRPYNELAKNQLTSKLPPQVSSPLYTERAGSGSVGANDTLGSRLKGYGAQIRTLIAEKWRTNDVDARYQSAPPVIATFDLMRDGSVKNLVILQGSGIPSLDNSVRRAIQDATLPPIPQGQGFDKDHARVEFTFELKR